MNDLSIQLSVLIPSYNDAAYVHKCISSLLDTERDDFEVIVSDDCSNKETIKILDSFNDPRLIVVKSSKRIGASNNWKKCLSLAKGNWVHFLASDDYYVKGSIEDILNSVHENNTVYLIKHLCFKDGSDKIFEVQCDSEKINQIFNQKKHIDWSRLLKFSNHDELVLCIFPRSKLKILSYLSKYSSYSSFMYWVYAIFYNVNLSAIKNGAVMKRYNHQIKRAAGGDLGKNKNALGISFKGFYGDFYNSLILSLYYRNPLMLVKLMFYNRYHSTQKGGLFGVTGKSMPFFYFGSFFNLLLSPILVTAKKLNIKKILKKEL